MKIIHVALGKVNNTKQNGVNKVIFELATEQKRLGFNVHFWGITKRPETGLNKYTFEKRLFQQYTNKFKLDIEMVLQVQELENPASTIFHLHGGYIPQFYSFTKLLRKQGFHYILTPHGSYNSLAMNRSFIRKWCYNLLFEYKVVKQASIVHLIGQSEIQGTQGRFGSISHALIPNGQQPVAQFPLFGNSDLLHFGYVGRIDCIGKGLNELIKGFALFLNQKNPPALLHIIGDGNELNHLKATCESLKIVEHVVFHGSLFGEQKQVVIRQLTALLLPSRNEGMPGVVLEALALGVPCIVSKATNLGTIIREKSLGIELESIEPEHLALSLKTASNWTLELRQQMAVQAKLTIQQSFNWSVIAKQFQALYQQVLHII